MLLFEKGALFDLSANGGDDSDDPLLVLLIMAATYVHAEEWSRFRGPNESGISGSKAVPVEFGPKKNMAWRTEVPFGSSSPILTADRLVVTASEGKNLITLCLDRATGKILWRSELPRDRTQKIFKGNDTATPTLASDGMNFVCSFPISGWSPMIRTAKKDGG